MMRIVHRWPGLVLVVLLLVMALSGAALSLFPAWQALQAPRSHATHTLAELAQRVQASHPGLEEIRRAPSGQISAWWVVESESGTVASGSVMSGSAVIHPDTGLDLAPATPGPVQRWLTTLHRSLFMGDSGRIATAAGALAMLLLAWSGVLLVVRRTGGWRRVFARLHGPQSGRLHTRVARIMVPGLVLSCLTALWMSAETFELIPVEAVPAEAPAEVSGRTGLDLSAMPALQATPLDAWRVLRFPAPGDAQDVFTLSTERGVGTVDQGTGALISWQELSALQRLTETLRNWHTGEGAAVLGLLLGLAALGVPVLAVTGVCTWLAGRRGGPRQEGNAPAARAETVVLVGSEGGSTWGFAATLASALRARGQTVHVAAMRGFAPARYRQVQRYLVLAATYGAGAAPASANGFLERLQALREPPAAPVAVLGFGDRSFPDYCAFAQAVVHAARAKGWPLLLPFETIDRQSAQGFARWGRSLGQAMGPDPGSDPGHTLELHHQPQLPATQTLTLLARRDYGAAVGVPMSILRFALPSVALRERLTGQRWTHFEPGDLLGIVPQGCTVPRLYSLASGAADGFIEIVVRRHEGGLASGQLTRLEPGASVRAYLRRNPAFHASSGSVPLILIGAGTGVGALCGIIRRNVHHRPVHLIFGLRRPDSDFLYQEELTRWQAEGRLAQISLAVSRGGAAPSYVQDVLRAEKAQVLALIRRGARIMVCGGSDMARGVTEALTEILHPAGMTPAHLKAEGRLAEDIY